jgi:signal transduction histidine kinase
MESQHYRATTDPHGGVDSLMLQRAIAELRNPLTVVSVHAQVLRGRIEHQEVHELEACLATLERISQAARALEAQLKVLECQAGPVATDEPRGRL